MKNLTPEMIENAKSVNSAEELLALAKENNIEMTADEAATYFAQLNPKSGEINDDDLDSVAGGACSANSDTLAIGTKVRVTSGQTCPKCGSNTGKVAYTAGGYVHQKGVVCPACSNEIIVQFLVDCTYEIIG